MASQTDICNMALAHIGKAGITDIDDGTPTSLRCLAFWENTRDEVLRLHEWNFAITRVLLVQEVEVPAYGYDYAYAKPSDCVRLLRIARDEYDLDNNLSVSIAYKLEGAQILCNEEELYCKYIKRVVETGLYDSLFTGALAARLAAKLAGALVLSAKMAQQMIQLSEYFISEAAGVNAREGGSPQRRVNSSWVDAHNGVFRTD